MSTDVFFGIALAAAIVGLVVYRLKYKRSPGVMNIVLLIAAILLAWFTVKMIQIYLAYGAIPDTLVNCVFLALTGEAGIMGRKRTSGRRNRRQKQPLGTPWPRHKAAVRTQERGDLIGIDWQNQ